MKLKISLKNFDEIEILETNEKRPILKARLIGLLLTDGGLSQIGTKWRIHFTSNSEILVNEFQEIIENLFNLKMYKEYRKGAWRVQCWVSKRVKEELLSYSSTYRTLSINGRDTEAKIPEFISNNSTFSKEFLKYAFTGDGTVIFNIGKARYGFRFDRCVKLYSQHSNLRKQYFELLKNLGYNPRMLNDSVLLRGRKDIIKFANEIGFVEDVKISGKGMWTGISKNELVKFTSNSYDLKPKSLGKTKDDIHTNLVNLILGSGYQMI